jgi:hypothetical protein
MQYLTYNWFRDIWIPGAGAILIPVVTVFFTWWFGASRAEKNKEIQELRDSLNFLSSLLSVNIMKLIGLRRRFLEIITIETKTEGIINQNELELVMSSLIAENYFKNMDIRKYVPCIKYDPNFIFKLTVFMNCMELIHDRIALHNQKMCKAGPIDELVKDIKGSINILRNDARENKEFIKELDSHIEKNRELLHTILSFSQKVPVLKLNKLSFSEKELHTLTDQEKKWIDFTEVKHE